MIAFLPGLENCLFLLYLSLLASRPVKNSSGAIDFLADFSVKSPAGIHHPRFEKVIKGDASLGKRQRT